MSNDLDKLIDEVIGEEPPTVDVVEPLPEHREKLSAQWLKNNKPKKLDEEPSRTKSRTMTQLQYENYKREVADRIKQQQAKAKQRAETDKFFINPLAKVYIPEQDPTRFDYGN